MKPLIARYPDFYAGSAEFKDLQEALEPEILALWERRDSVLDQLCIDTATWGLKYWEQSLGIPVEESKEVEFRRSRVKAKMRGAGTTTVATIKSVSESFSNGAVEITEFADQFRIEIKFVGTIGYPPNMNDLTDALRDIMPAHLAWDYIYVYNTWQDMTAITWERAASRTWGKIKEVSLND